MKNRKNLLFAALSAVLMLTLLAIPALAVTLSCQQDTYQPPVSVFDAGDIEDVALSSGALPAGMSWSWQSGDTAITVSGTPTEAGSFSAVFHVRCTSNPDATATVEVVVTSPTPTPHTHTYEGSWQSDESQHWHVCECGERGDVALHTYGGSWQSDESQHWHVCECGRHGDVAQHTLSAWSETLAPTETTEGQRQAACQVCGRVFVEAIPVLSHTHHFDSAWHSDESSHWHQCSCGEQSEKADHTVPEDKWTVTRKPTNSVEGEKWGVCSVCGKIVTEKIPVITAPVVTKHPTGETLETGGQAIFISRAEHAESCQWLFVDKNNREVKYTQAGNYFPGLTVSGGGTDTLTISNVPQTMDGWYAVCCFSNQGGESVRSNGALITVNKAAAKVAVITQQPKAASLFPGETTVLSVRALSPDGGSLRYQWYRSDTGYTGSNTPIPGATASTYQPAEREGTTYYCVSVINESGSSTAAAVYSELVAVTYEDEPEPTPTPEPTPEPHTHSFDSEWHGDLTGHFHLCQCGEHSEYESHDYEWTVVRKASRKAEGEEKGVCKVCGYQIEQSIPMGGGSSERNRVLLGLLGALALLVISVAALLILKLTGKLTIEREDEYADDDDPEEDEDAAEDEPYEGD